MSEGRGGGAARNRVMMGCCEVRVCVDVRVDWLVNEDQQTHTQDLIDGKSRRLEG